MTIAIDKPTAIAALEAAKGDITEASKALGMSYRTLYRRLDALGLHRALEKIRASAPAICPHCKRPM